MFENLFWVRHSQESYALLGYDEASNHVDVDCAENVAVDSESSRDGGREDYLERVTGGKNNACIQVGHYGETMGLRRVLVADQQTDYVSPMRTNHRPRVRRCAVTNAVVEA